MLPAARDLRFQTEGITILMQHVKSETVWRWAWFCWFNMLKSVVFQTKHDSFSKYIWCIIVNCWCLIRH